MDQIATYTTGSRRGYIAAAHRGKESDPLPVPASLEGLRGNERRAMEKFIAAGCTHYTVAQYQGTSKGYSNQYCYTVYNGYKKKDKISG